MTNLVSGYIGTYTQGGYGRAQGIYRFTLNTESGVIEDIRLAAGGLNPSYLALSSSGECLYAVNETGEFQGHSGGAVSAFARDRGSGGLSLINQRPSRGKGPCHIALNDGGTHAVAANYSSGVLAVFPLEAGGGLADAVQVIPFSGTGPDHKRQEGPHAHFFMFDRSCAFGFACDLGTDRIMAYAFDKNAAEPLSPAPAPWYSSKPGAGPRHGVFNAGGTVAYVLNELDSTVDVLAYDRARGAFEKRQSLSGLPAGTAVPSIAAAIKLGPGGKFLYASNRGYDSIAVFKVLDGSGALEFLEAIPSGGKTPRDFTPDPSGNFLLAVHQDSDNLVIFRVDPATGLFKQEREYTVPSPVCIITVP